jgi:REP element-mobilizing transposase RayT
MKYNPEIHHRRSIRLKGYDYTQPGAYFVTCCSYKRAEIFGRVRHGEIELSALGVIVHNEWRRSAKVRKEIQLFEDEFVVMPNHIHAIVRIIETAEITGTHLLNGRTPSTPTNASQSVPLRLARRSLGSFLAGFKASVTSRAKRELNMTSIWQRNYFEHIIRNEVDFNNIWHYIDTNPLHWQEDKLHPSAPQIEDVQNS